MLKLDLICECADTNDWRPLDKSVGEVVHELIEEIQRLSLMFIDQKPASTVLVEEMSTDLNIIAKDLQDVFPQEDEDLTVTEHLKLFIGNYKALVEDYENLLELSNNDSNDPSEDHLGEHYLVQQDKDNDAKDKNTTE